MDISDISIHTPVDLLHKVILVRSTIQIAQKLNCNRDIRPQ
jgi:hypothetical protein